MNDPEDIEGLAGEYVLGTLDPLERARLASQRARDPKLDAAIAMWERRLSPLDETTNDVEPPGDMLARIEAAFGIGDAAGADIAALTRRLAGGRPDLVGGTVARPTLDIRRRASARPGLPGFRHRSQFRQQAPDGAPRRGGKSAGQEL